MNQELKLGALLVVVLGAATIFQLQQVKIKRLVAENADLSSQVVHMAWLQDTNELLAKQLKAAAASSQANQSELSRLRGQAVRLPQLEQENAQVKAQRQQSERQTSGAQPAVVDSAAAPQVLLRLNTIKTAVVEFYAKYGALPGATNLVEPTLTTEGLLQESMPYSSNVRTRVMEISDPTAPIDAKNQAYSLDGHGTNVVFGSLVVEGVVVNVSAAGAREMSRLVDGEMLSSPVGEADLKGRVKFDAIPSEGSGEVHVYLTHR